MFGRHYQPLNVIDISEKNLIHNYKYLSSLSELKIAPVLKSNAYGHGLVGVAKVLEKLDPPFICVDSLYEGYELLKGGIRTKILIMGFIDPISLKTKRLPFSFAVYNNVQIDSLNKFQPKANIHIFVDTGMHREGILMDELHAFVSYIKNKTTLNIEGLMSHFGESESKNNPVTKTQLKNFKKCMEVINPKFVHIANSGGVLNRYGIGNVGRCGISLFGISPIKKDKNLKPVLNLKTHIAQIKEVEKGESVGYSFTYKAKKDMRIAILPIGYYDGVDRRLSNKGYVLVKKTPCQIIGRISMNIMEIDVSNLKNIKVGDEVVIYSNNSSDINSIENSAKICNTIPYELLVKLSESTKRVVVGREAPIGAPLLLKGLGY